MISASRSIARLALALGALSLREAAAPPPSLGAVEALIEAAGPIRPLEARLTGGFRYAACAGGDPAANRRATACDGSFPVPGTDWKAFSEAAKRIAGEAARRPSAAAWHGLGLLRLITSAEDDRAVAALEASAETSGRPAASLSDLAAAYLRLAQRRREPGDLVRALTAVDRATRADPALPEARFNRALVLERLCLRTGARAAWEDYLRLDPRSGWAEEARTHLQRLSAPAPQLPLPDRLAAQLRSAGARGDRTVVAALVARDRQAARELVEQELLGEWADAMAAGQGEKAPQLLASARLIAEGLAAKGERLASAAVAAITAAAGERQSGRLAELVAGHRAFRDGYLLFRTFKPQAALARLQAACDRLRQGTTPFVWRAELWKACNLYQLDRYDASLACLAGIRSSATVKSSPALAGHVAWMEALNQTVRGDVVSAVGLYSEALAHFSAGAEAGNVLSMHGLLAEPLDMLGRMREAWRHRYQTLQGAAGLRDPRMRNQAFQVMAQSFLLDGQPELAAYFQDEAVAEAVAAGVPEMEGDAYFWRALVQDRLGHGEQALADLERAKRSAALQSDPVFRQRTLADVAWIEGSLLTGRAPSLATALLSSSLAFYRTVHHDLHIMLAYLARARSYRLLAQPARAEADLRAGLEAYERLGHGLAQQEQVFAFLARDENLFDEMISFQQDEHRRPDLGFAYSDRQHSRVLPGTASGRQMKRGERERFLREQGSPIALDALRRSLPPGVTLVEYSLQRDRLYTWVVSREGLRSVRTTLDSSRLEPLLRELEKEVKAGAAPGRPAVALYDLLIRPWVEALAPGTALVFVPDKLLQGIPFACLRGSPTGRYLIEDHRVEIAPSASLYARARGRWPRSVSPGRGVLVVGDPAVDPSWELPTLPGSGDEAAAVAGLYGPSAHLLRGAQADKARFLELAAGAPLIHFAGHATVDARDPLLSALVLAPARHGSGLGALTMREIYALDLSRTRLVVLSACEAAGGGELPGEGVGSLARAFLVAGVPAVVASLWRIDDQTTGALLTDFHRRLLAGEEPATALQQAQLALLRGGNQHARLARSWAGFEVIGAGAS